MENCKQGQGARTWRAHAPRAGGLEAWGWQSGLPDGAGRALQTHLVAKAWDAQVGGRSSGEAQL